MADKGIERVLLVNPGPEPLTLRPELPADWFAPREAANELKRNCNALKYVVKRSDFQLWQIEAFTQHVDADYNAAFEAS